MSKAVGGFLIRVGNYKPLYKSFIENAKNGKLECSDQNILYQVLRASDAKEASEVIATEFTRSDTGEPMTKRLQATISDWKNLCAKYEKLFINDKLSLIAKDIEKNEKIVGALLCCDLFSESKANIDPVATHDKLFPLFDILLLLENSYYNKEHAATPKQCYHQFLGGVNSDYKKQDILYNLTILSNLKAKIDGYQGVYVEPTGPLSQRVFETLGYKKLGEIKYDEYSHPIIKEKTFDKLSEEFAQNSTRFTPTNNNTADQLGCQICYKDLHSNDITELVGNVFESDNIN